MGEDRAGLLTSLEFENLLTERAVNMNTILEAGRTLADQITALVESIERALDR